MTVIKRVRAKKTPHAEHLKKVFEGVAAGLSLESSCDRAGIDFSDWLQWQAEDESIDRRVRKSRADFEFEQLERAKKFSTPGTEAKIALELLGRTSLHFAPRNYRLKEDIEMVLDKIKNHMSEEDYVKILSVIGAK